MQVESYFVSSERCIFYDAYIYIYIYIPSIPNQEFSFQHTALSASEYHLSELTFPPCLSSPYHHPYYHLTPAQPSILQAE